MNVADLKQRLNEFPEDYQIILQRDSEGNGYSPAAGADTAYYEADTPYMGTCVNENEVKEYAPAAKPCVVLWPLQ